MAHLVSRDSKLARVQVEEFLATLSLDPTPKVTYLKSMGDVDLSSSLMDPTVPGNFFTAELDTMLLAGSADYALHSAKDLPYPLPQGLSVAALTKSEDTSDALVARHGLTLATLPQGARLGTSSSKRKEQILALRPDLTIVSIRGDILRRLDYVDRGECDAIIVATIALKRLGLHQRISEILTIATHPLQGSLAVVARSNRFDIAALVAPLDHRRTFGEVLLVGAGPGDPDLITRKGEKAIRTADIIFYDALIDNEILTWATGETVFVGKRKGEHYRKQEEINVLLYEAALTGKKVVRLKCGDPLLFSRGGEEIDYLKERHVAVSIVPGVSSFQGAAASLCFPLTKRTVARSITALSAQYEKPTDIPITSSGTQIVFMGATKSTDVQAALRSKGWPETSPIALISRATYTDEVLTLVPLSQLGEQKPAAPAMIVVGTVTSYAHQEPKVLFTGLDPSRTAVRGNLVHQPLIELAALPVAQKGPRATDTYDGFIFTSKAAVHFFFEHHTITPGATIVAIGPHTATEVERYGHRVDHLPHTFDAKSLAELITSCEVSSWLYPCSSRSKNSIHNLVNVDAIPYYATQFCTVTPLDLSTFSAVLFSSPSTVDAFLQNYREIPEHLQLIVYGEPTAAKLTALGVPRERVVVSPILPPITSGGQ